MIFQTFHRDNACKRISMKTKPEFMTCMPVQYKQGKARGISEIISPEEPCHVMYECTHTNGAEQQVFSGKKTLHAYPIELEKLVLGHTVLDLLPCYDADFTYTLQQEDAAFKVKLKATDKKRVGHAPQKLSFAKALATMGTVLDASGLWDGTGCFHRAALYHPAREEYIFAEDIGRHNCVDRLKGHTLMHNLPIEEYFLFITARITTSLYQKIRRAGITHMVSRSAITSFPYENACKDQCTLAAFCRPEDERLTLFCGTGIY